MLMLCKLFANKTLYSVNHVRLLSRHASRQHSLKLPQGMAHTAIGTALRRPAASLSSLMSFKAVRLMTFGKREVRHYTPEPSPTNATHATTSSVSSVGARKEGGFELVYRAPLSKQLLGGASVTGIGVTACLFGALLGPFYLVFVSTLKVSEC